VWETADWRKEPLLAARSIPDSFWFLIVKIDSEESYAPISWTLLAGCNSGWFSHTFRRHYSEVYFAKKARAVLSETV
jgi:hypothetical protein